VNIVFVKKSSGHAVSKHLWIISNLVISLVPYPKAKENYKCFHILIGAKFHLFLKQCLHDLHFLKTFTKPFQASPCWHQLKYLVFIVKKHCQKWMDLRLTPFICQVLVALTFSKKCETWCRIKDRVEYNFIWFHDHELFEQIGVFGSIARRGAASPLQSLYSH
jgi:hypothetical protein